MINYSIEYLYFNSNQFQLEAKLYRVKEKDRPIILMAHGFAAEMDYGLYPFAHEFAQLNFNVFMFNYRGFGNSEGKVKHLVDHRKHIEDIQNAIKFIGYLKNINTNKIILWGSSYGGGHVLTIAAKNKKIYAVIAQVPFVDGIATILNLPVKNLFLGTFYGILDIIYNLFNKTYYIPVVSTPDKFAAMNTYDSYDGYIKLVPENKRNHNYCAARISFTLPFYRPIKIVHKIQCPVLLIAAEKDSLIPLKAIEKTISRIKHLYYKILPCGHFDIYNGYYFNENIKIQKEFLNKIDSLFV
ncbi:MAG: alpha/beta hydrolase [Leptospiraceae bacterium]|nr:MAG: alpha/beta hydrolase [Leptospiraceae bacterium]